MNALQYFRAYQSTSCFIFVYRQDEDETPPINKYYCIRFSKTDLMFHQIRQTALSRITHDVEIIEESLGPYPSIIEYFLGPRSIMTEEEFFKQSLLLSEANHEVWLGHYLMTYMNKPMTDSLIQMSFDDFWYIVDVDLTVDGNSYFFEYAQLPMKARRSEVFTPKIQKISHLLDTDVVLASPLLTLSNDRRSGDTGLLLLNNLNILVPDRNEIPLTQYQRPLTLPVYR